MPQSRHVLLIGVAKSLAKLSFLAVVEALLAVVSGHNLAVDAVAPTGSPDRRKGLGWLLCGPIALLLLLTSASYVTGEGGLRHVALLYRQLHFQVYYCTVETGTRSDSEELTVTLPTDDTIFRTIYVRWSMVKVSALIYKCFVAFNGVNRN